MKQSERAHSKAGNILFVSATPDILFVRKFCQGYWHKNIREQRRNLKADVSWADKSSLSVRRKAEPRAQQLYTWVQAYSLSNKQISSTISGLFEGERGGFRGITKSECEINEPRSRIERPHS